MSNLPTNALSQNSDQPVVVSPVANVLGLLKYAGVETQIVKNEGPTGGEGIVLRIPMTILSTFDGQEGNKNASTSFMRSMLYPFQELVKLIGTGTISGFAIVPTEDKVGDAVQHQRCEIIGRTLQSLANGEITLS